MSMADTFVPFLALGKSPAEAFAPRSQAPSAERPASKSTLPKAGSEAPAVAALPTCAATHGEPAQPIVTLHQEDGRVTRIRVQCACGQVIDLDCVY